MKLITTNETFQAEKIVKSDLNIIGYDINDNEIFSFKGISDFTGFQLQDENGNVIEFPLSPDPDSELASAIQAATTLDGLKAALLGSGKLVSVKGKMK